ncbi:MAG: hypothetical protein KME08_04985 [Aphanothece sp. CMT-3BRIN-NPC111]|nr:hypothetical protein [Aphanothece sp. CMT-3BRIN-NPC111]
MIVDSCYLRRTTNDGGRMSILTHEWIRLSRRPRKQWLDDELKFIKDQFQTK